MMTVITETTIKRGSEHLWDSVFEERLDSAKRQPGWVDLQLLVPPDQPNKRVVVGTWRSRDDWENWHRTEAFQRTRDRLDKATESDGQNRWYEVRERSAMQA